MTKFDPLKSCASYKDTSRVINDFWVQVSKGEFNLGSKILLGPGILVKLATYKLSLFTFCLPSQGRQTQLVGCKFGLNTRTKQNLDIQ